MSIVNFEFQENLFRSIWGNEAPVGKRCLNGSGGAVRVYSEGAGS